MTNMQPGCMQGSHSELTPSRFINRRVKADLSASPVQIAKGCSAEAPVYVFRLDAEQDFDIDKIIEYGRAGARAYELYVITLNGVIARVNHRIQQVPCADRSFAPHNASLWMFPDEAMFDLDWEDIAASARKEMICCLQGIVEDSLAARER